MFSRWICSVHWDREVIHQNDSQTFTILQTTATRCLARCGSQPHRRCQSSEHGAGSRVELAGKCSCAGSKRNWRGRTPFRPDSRLRDGIGFTNKARAMVNR